MKKTITALFALFLLSPAFVSAEQYSPPPPATEAIISEISARYGIDMDLALAIAWCESRFKVQAKNWNSNGTKDVGLYQINDIHIPELVNLDLTRYDARENAIFAMKLMSRNGTRDFKSSSYCWAPLYQELKQP